MARVAPDDVLLDHGALPLRERTVRDRGDGHVVEA
jgi:hypothetical protein